MLSKSQEQVVTHKQGPCLTLAGPGSGKTLCLTQRIAHLIAEGVMPENILVITFTRAAALEMKERFTSLVGEGAPVVFGTFHSVFYGMLRQERSFSSYQLMDRKMKRQILKEVFAICKVPIEQEDATEILEKEISYLKNTMIDEQEYCKISFFGEDIISLFEHYELKKTAYHLLDFDDMLNKTLELLKNDFDFCNKWQKKFRYILIDEIQDMNQLQFEIIRILAYPENNLFVVGDDDQSIYGFRGANPEIMLNFPKYYPNCVTLLLGENYRCGSNIVKSSAFLIGHNKNRYEKSVEAKASVKGEVIYQSYEDEQVEASEICQQIVQSHEHGVQYEQMVVLFRNHSQIAPLLDAFHSMHIPFQMREAMPNLYAHEIMEDMISYLRLTENQLHRKDLFRVMNRPNRYLARASVEREWTTFSAWEKYYEKQDFVRERIERLERDVEFMGKLSGAGAIRYIRKKIGYDTYLRERAKSPEELSDFYEVADIMLSLAKDTKNPAQVIAKWQELRDEMDRRNEQTRTEKKEGVCLYTLHTAKGLEFDDVYIIDCNEGMLPSLKKKGVDNIEEERRLFYVGMTRAKKKLVLCSVESYFGKKISPSRFLLETQEAVKRE